MSILRRSLILFSLLAFHFAVAQRTGNSPFSRFGLGDLSTDGSVRNQGMAGIGTGYLDTVYLNFVNPAMLSFNKLTCFDAGLYHTTRELTQGSSSQINRGGNLNHIALGFPVSKRWGSVIGLSRFSSVNFNFETVEPVPSSSGGTLYQKIEGTGGLTRVFWGNGFSISRTLKLGIQASYLFGDIFSEDTYRLTGTLSTGDQIVLFDQYRLRNWYMKGGLAYVEKVGPGKKLLFTSGLTVEVGESISASYSSFMERQRLNGAVLTQDLVERNIPITYVPPAFYKMGFGIQRPNKWSLAMDIQYGTWSEFELSGRSQGLVDAIGISVGGEWTPNRSAIGKMGIFKRSIYRAGAYYNRTEIVINNEQVPDFGINFGASLPVKRLISKTEYNYAVSTINLSVQIGRRGIQGGNNFSERYLGFKVGVTILDKWFERYKYD